MAGPPNAVQYQVARQRADSRPVLTFSLVVQLAICVTHGICSCSSLETAGGEGVLVHHMEGRCMCSRRRCETALKEATSWLWHNSSGTIALAQQLWLPTGCLDVGEYQAVKKRALALAWIYRTKGRNGGGANVRDRRREHRVVGSRYRWQRYGNPPTTKDLLQIIRILVMETVKGLSGMTYGG